MSNKFVANLSGGMNAKASPLVLKDTQCEVILNYSLDTIGALTKRNGYDVFASQPVASRNVNGLYQYTNTATTAETTQVMVANNADNSNSAVYYNSSGTWTSSRTDNAVSTPTNFNRFRFVTFLDYLFRLNGQQVVATSIDVNGGVWGATNAPATIIPVFCAVFQDRVYVANDQRTGANRLGSRLYWSGLPTGGPPPTISWTITTDFVDVNPDDGDEITALENNGNRLLIFKNRSMYRWVFGQTEPDRIIGIGTQSQECVKTNFDLGITFFANEYGAYAYSGGRPKLISRPIQKWFDNVPAGDVDAFAAETDSDHYYLYLSDSMTVDGRTYSNVMAVYTVSLDAWVIYTLHAPVRFMAKFIQSNSEDVYFGSSNGRTYQWNSGTGDDSGGASGNVAVEIHGEILSKEYLLSFPEKSELEWLDLISSQRIGAKVSYQIDRDGDFSPLGQLSKRISSYSLGKKSGHTIRLRIAESSTNTSIIDGWNIESTPKQKRTQR